MTLRVSLVIDGNASGAKQAAGEATQALTDLRQRGVAAVRAEGDRMAGAMQANLARVRSEADATVTSLTRVSASAAMQSGNLAQSLNAQLNVRNDFGADRRAADVAAYGEELDRLRARFNPIFAAGQQYKAVLAEINAAARLGAISERERADAIQRTKDAFAQQVSVLRGTAGANDSIAGSARRSRAEMINLSRQIQDVGVGLASGQSPFMVAVQQGAQIGDIFASSERSVGDFFKQAVSGLARLFTPARLAAGAVLGIGLAAVTAASQWGEAQRQVELGLIGIGRASGATAADINRIAQGASSTFGLSRSEARGFATELASTGKIGKENIEPIVKLGHDVAVSFGTDAAGAAKMLAKAFADPVKGASELNERLGFLNDANRALIQSLDAQGRRNELQRVMIDAIAQSTARAAEHTGFWAASWNAVSNTVSNAWDSLGHFMSRITGIGQSLEEQLDRLKRQRDDLSGPEAGLFAVGAAEQVKDINDQIAGLEQKLQRSAEAAQRVRDNLLSLQAADVVRRLAPETTEKTEAENNIALLKRKRAEAVATMGQFAGTFDPKVVEAWDAAIARAETRLRMLGVTAGGLAQMQQQLERQSILAVSPGQRGEVAFKQMELQFLQRGIDIYGETKESVDALRAAEQARSNTILSATVQISRQHAEQLLTAKQGVDAAELELQILGRAAAEQEGLRAKLQAKQQLEQEALRTQGDREAYDKNHLAALEKEIDRQAALKQLLAEQQALRDIAFEREQIGRTSDEQQVYARLRQTYGENYKAYENGEMAQGMRRNQELSFLHDNSLGLLKDFNSALRQGRLDGEAFGQAVSNALAKIQDRLLEMVFNDVWNMAFGGRGSGFSLFGFGGGEGGGGSAGGFASGGYTGDIAATKIAGVVHGREFVFDAETTRRIGPANLEAWRRSVRGYAEGGYVGPPMAPGYASGGAGAGSAPFDLHIHEAPGVETKVEKSRRPDGGERIDLRQSMKQTAVEAIGEGDADAVNRARYGTRRIVAKR